MKKVNPDLELIDGILKLSEHALELLNVTVGDIIDIKYHSVNNTSVPVIGSIKAFGTQAGNKIRATNNIVFKGNKNKLLKTYGESFILIPYRDGLFYLIDTNKEIHSVPDECKDNRENIDNDHDWSVDNTEYFTINLFEL